MGGDDMALEFYEAGSNDERVAHLSTEVPDDPFSGEALRAARDAFKGDKILSITLDSEAGVKVVVAAKKGGK